MRDFLDTPIDLDRLCRLTELAGLAALERLHTGAYDDPPSTLDPGRDVKVIALTEALAPALPGNTAEIALLLLDETAEGPLIERLAVEGEGWHGYACAVPPSTYLAVCFTGGRDPESIGAEPAGLEAIYRQIARALDLLLAPAERARDLETEAAPGYSRADQRARLVARALALKTLRLTGQTRLPAGGDGNALSANLVNNLLVRPLQADPDLRARCTRFFETHALAA